MMSCEELSQFEGIGEILAINIVKERNSAHFKDEEDLRRRIKNLPKPHFYEF
jgi:DNA uptake protein ComE-like DNA-binding protein